MAETYTPVPITAGTGTNVEAVETSGGNYRQGMHIADGSVNPEGAQVLGQALLTAINDMSLSMQSLVMSISRPANAQPFLPPGMMSIAGTVTVSISAAQQGTGIAPNYFQPQTGSQWMSGNGRLVQ